MFQFLQSCDFVDGHQVLDRALDFLMSVWFDVTDAGPSAVAVGRKIDPSKKLLHIVEQLINDQRIDIDQNWTMAGSDHHFWFCPSEILPLVDRSLTYPMKTLTVDEKLDFLDLRFSSDQIAPDLIASTIPMAEASNSPPQMAARLGGNPLDLIAKYMGRRIKHGLSKFKETDINRFWNLVSTDPILLQLEELLVSWVRFGYSLSSINSYGFTPLQQFLHAQSRWIRSTRDLLPVQYWANCISNAGIDLTEYGKTEMRAWQKLVRVAWRRDPLHGYNIRVWATGFTYGQDVNSWHLLVEQHTHIPLYRLEVLPGSWPEAAFVPRAICWKTSTTRLQDGNRWIFDKEVVMFSDSVPSTDPRKASEYIRLLEDTQDDSLAAARLLVGQVLPHGKRRRRNSEPSPLHHSKGQKESDSNKPWLRGYFHYCPICYDRFDTQGHICHRSNHKQETCSEEHIWEGERLFRSLVQWRKFVIKHGSRPVQCLRFRAETLVNPLAYQLVDALDIFSNLEEPWFCDEFPHCLHQRSYLDLISQPFMNTNQLSSDV
jgi:hypothetical protein